ncbi:MAG: A24 family peptidase [Acidiferrobacteraceae bacterium]
MFSGLQFYLQIHPGLFLTAVALYGLVLGSFLNVVILRVPAMLDRDWRSQCRELLELPQEKTVPAFNLLRPGSQCPHCGHPIRAWENIPVVSYLLLRGRCSECGTPISPRYPLIELATAILSVGTAWHFGVTIQSLGALILVWGLIPLAVIDYEHKILPDSITLPFLWLGLIFSSFGTFTDLQSAVFGAIAGYLSLWLVYQGFRLLTGKEGIGFGDFKLFALFGAWLGWQQLPILILIAAFTGAVIGGASLYFSRRGRDHPIPFGPFLCVAGWITLLWGDTLTRAYLQLARIG